MVLMHRSSMVGCGFAFFLLLIAFGSFGGGFG
jgi:hypothetical protein